MDITAILVLLVLILVDLILVDVEETFSAFRDKEMMDTLGRIERTLYRLEDKKDGIRPS